MEFVSRYKELFSETLKKVRANDQPAVSISGVETDRETLTESKGDINVQVVRKGTGPENLRSFIQGPFKSKPDAQKWVKWYETGKMGKVEKVTVYQEGNDFYIENLNELLSEADSCPKCGLPSCDGECNYTKEDSNTIYKVEKDGKLVFKGKYNQVLSYRKQHGGKISVMECFDIFKEEALVEFSRSQLDVLARQYADLKGKTISIDNANKLRKIFDKIPDHFLNDLRKKHIPFLSGLALSRMVQKGIPVRAEEVDKPKVNLGEAFDKGLIEKAVEIARKMANNYTGATNVIEKIARGLSKDPTVSAALLKANEDVIKEATYHYEFTITSDYGNDGPDQEDEGTLSASSDKDAENKAEKLADKFADKINKQKKSVNRPGGFETKDVSVYKESVDPDYLKSKLTPQQIANTKKVWQKKKASDVTAGVKALIKKMDIPTQLAIKQADIPHISKLIETIVGKYREIKETRINEGRMKDIYTMDQDGATVKEIAKKLKLKISTVKGILGEKRIRPPRQLNLQKEGHQPGFAVRYLDPKNGKRFAAAYKTKKDADDKAAQLKKDGAKDISITKHTLNFKEDDDKAYAIGMAKAKEIKKDSGTPLKKSTIEKGHEIAKAIKKNEAAEMMVERVINRIHQG